MNWKQDLLREVRSLGLFGQIESHENDAVIFERIPLLLSKAESADAIRGKGVWFDSPAGWFATKDSDLLALIGWMPDYIAPYFYLAKNVVPCWRCKKTGPVFSMISKGNHFQRRELDDMEDGEKINEIEWIVGEYGDFTGMFLSNVTLVNGRVQRYLAERCPSYRVAFSKTAASNYFMNHCTDCDAKFGDFFIHGEPGGAFFPTTEVEAGRIELYRVDLPLLAQGNGSVSTPDMIPYCSDIDVVA
jgi:hypothetical protein